MTILLLIIILLLLITVSFSIYILIKKTIFSTFSNLNSSIINNNNTQKYYLTSSGGGLRAMYGAYSFIKAIQENKKNNEKWNTNIKKIGVVSGSSWFFTQLYHNSKFRYDFETSLTKYFVIHWNKNYCNNIDNLKKKISLQKGILCWWVNYVLNFLSTITKFVNIPGKNWKIFVNEVILKYGIEQQSITLTDLPELLYGISLPFTIFQKHDKNNGLYIKTENTNDSFYKNYKLCCPIYYNYKSQLFTSPSKILNDKTLTTYSTKINNCDFNFNDSKKLIDFNISDLQSLDNNGKKDINKISAACSAAVGLLSSPVILNDLIKDKVPVIHNSLCNTIEDCLPTGSLDLSVDMNIKDTNDTYKVIDGAYTDNSALAITLSNIFTNKNLSKNSIINVVSLNHSEPKKLNKSKIDTTSVSDLYRLFNNNNLNGTVDGTVDGPFGGQVPTPILFNESFPDGIGTGKYDRTWNWDFTCIKYCIGRYTTTENIHYGIPADYTINLVMILFDWPTGMIDYDIRLNWLNDNLNKQYISLCEETIKQLQKLQDVLPFEL